SSNSLCCAAGIRGYGITQSDTKCPWKSPFANPSACGPAKSSSSACWISFCRCASSLFIQLASRKKRATNSSRACVRVQFTRNSWALQAKASPPKRCWSYELEPSSSATSLACAAIDANAAGASADDFVTAADGTGDAHENAAERDGYAIR